MKKKNWMVLPLALLLVLGLAFLGCDNDTTTTGDEPEDDITGPGAVEGPATGNVAVTAAAVELNEFVTGGIAVTNGTSSTFTENDFVLFEIGSALVAEIEAAATIEIQFTVASQTGQFRFGLGDPVNLGSGWNYTGLAGGTDLLPAGKTVLSLNSSRNVDVTPAYVLIQARNGAATLNITAINIHLTEEE